MVSEQSISGSSGLGVLFAVRSAIAESISVSAIFFAISPKPLTQNPNIPKSVYIELSAEYPHSSSVIIEAVAQNLSHWSILFSAVSSNCAIVLIYHFIKHVNAFSWINGIVI